MRTRTLAAIALLALPATLPAQSATTDTVFARSPWGGEAAIGGATAVSLLHVGPSGSAWVFSLAGNLHHLNTTFTPAVGPAQEQKVDGGQAALQIGRRSYRGTAPLRPFVGAGLMGSYGGEGGTHEWGAGGYGELGAAYFVAPRVSLGVGEMLQFTYTHQWMGKALHTNTWSLNLPFPTARVTVFF